MACQGCGSILINYSGDPSRSATARLAALPRPTTTSAEFSQPTGLDVAGFGNTGRNFFRRPAQWNVDLGIFKSFPIGRFRPEFRIEIANLFNNRNWGAPNTTFTSPNFLHVLAGQRRHHGNARLPPNAAGLPLPVLVSPERASGPCRGRASLSWSPGSSGRPGGPFRAGGMRSRRPFLRRDRPNRNPALRRSSGRPRACRRPGLQMEPRVFRLR